ncbi:ankyrin-1-like [Sitodiplosis mosellana]|uniref:ankyrin-1-like n=1 Tax=Sitodiplosis mosellana TaxID=263140 RepID=UPI002443B8D3|nr:ankyrin-1-like [Sitodiplosis mosellana]
MKYYLVLFLCCNVVLSKVPEGLNLEKHLHMREEELNLVKTIDNEIFKDGPWKLILDAAQDCNLQKMEEQIDQGTNIDIKDNNGRTALHTAARQGCEQVVYFLVENGANVNTKCDKGWTSLHWAAYNGKVNIAQVLITHGADMNVGDINGLTPLHLAVHQNREKMVHFFISKGVAMNVKCRRGWTPIFTASFKGNVPIAILLIQNGMNVDDTDDDKWTPLHVAAYEGYTLIMKLLVRKGANVNAVEIDKWTPLHLAAQEGNDEAVEALLKWGAHVDPITMDGRTPLFITLLKDRSIKYVSSYSTISRGREEMVELLLIYGANPNFKYMESWSLCHEAAEKGNERIIKLLINYGVNVNVQDSNKWTPLHIATQNGHVKVVELLIKNGTLSYKDKSGQSPLDLALIRGDVNIIELVKTVLSPAQHACKIYLKLPIDRVLGGEAAGPAEFPWMAALGYRSANEKVTFDCGGTVISEFFIMTAAHCARQSRPPIVVRLGKLTLTDDDDPKLANFQVQEIIRHSNYSFLTKRNDIALIRVGKRINFTTEIVPACLQTDLRDEGVDVELLATGWGTTDSDRIVLSNSLQKTQLTSMPLTECNRTLFELNRDANQAALRNGIGGGQYCAYDPQARNDSCQGDSGGPLQYFDENDSGIATVLGIVSVGFGCGTALPSLYTRVAFYMDWIEPIVWPAA